MTRHEMLLGTDDAERLAIGKTLDAYDAALQYSKTFKKVLDRYDTAERRVAAENVRRSLWYFAQAQQYLETARRAFDSTAKRELTEKERLLF